MDKLSEHAIRMLEIVDGENDFFRNDNERQADIARAVYDIILQVQMLKMADRKTEPSDSEKPNNCETCKNWDIVNDHCYFIQECNYEPKTEPQKCYLRESCDHYGDKQVCGRCREYNLYSHTKNEPQTDCAWGKGE